NPEVSTLRQCRGGLGQPIGPGGTELAHNADEVGMLQTRHQESPPVGTLLVNTDVLAVGVGEDPTSGPLKGVDVHLDLPDEKIVDRRTELQKVGDGVVALVGAEVDGDLVDKQAVHASVAGLAGPVEAGAGVAQTAKPA